MSTLELMSSREDSEAQRRPAPIYGMPRLLALPAAGMGWALQVADPGYVGGPMGAQDGARKARHGGAHARPDADLNEELQQLRAIVEASEDAIITVDKQGHFIGWNPGATRLLGYDRVMALGMGLADICADGSWKQALSHALEHGAVGRNETVWRDREGRRLWINVSAAKLSDTSGETTGLALTARDITERKESEARLRLMESVVINTNDAVVITDPGVGTALGPTILFVNEAFTKITGFLEHEVLGKSPRILYGPQTDPETLNHIKEKLSKKQSVRVEIVNYAKDGRAYWVDLSMVPAFGEGGEFTHLIAVEREITERKLAEFLEADQRQVLEMIARGAELSDVLSQVINLVERQRIGVHVAMLMNTGGPRLRHLMAPNVPPSVLEAVDSADLRCGGAWVMEALATPGVSHVSHLGTHPQWQGLGEKVGEAAPQAVWAAPVRPGAEYGQGVILAYCDWPGEPSAADLALLEMASGLASIGIEQRQLSERLVHQAQHDALTQLPNRYLFEVRLQEALQHAEEGRSNVGLLCIDLDRFKQINDTLGHSVGDELLIQVSRRLSTCTRASDTLARMGGDEFVLVLHQLANPATSTQVADRLLSALKDPFFVQGYELLVTTSIGIGIYPQDGRDGSTLLKNADSALYHAKASGRNCYKFFRPRMNAMTFERLELENELRRALDRDELLLHYQPQVNLKTMEIVGFEALVRWKHHRLGMVSPGEFIPLAEEVGMIIPIGQWVLEEACRQKVAWEAAGLCGRTISVNVSALQFGHDNFVATVSEVLMSTGVPDHGWLDLEVTESLLAKDINLVAGKLDQLRKLGVTVSIDDFGTGYSNLKYLQRLPLDTLKIDNSFVRTIGEAAEGHDDGSALVRAVLTLGHNLGLEVVAEGVETKAQLEFLQSLGCNRAQGYLLARPMPADKVLELYGEGKWFAMAG